MKIDRNRQVQLVAIKRQYKTLGKNFSLIPIWDPRSQRYVTGLEVLEPEQKNNLYAQYFKDIEDPRYFINDGLWLDLKDDYDFMRYLLCLVNPEIAYTRRDIIANQHLFFLNDAIEEAEIETKRIDLIDDALDFVRSLSHDKVRGLAAYLDLSINELPEQVMVASVKKKAIDDPATILKFKEHPEQSLLMFVHKLIVYDILSVEPDGLYFKTRYLAGTKEELLGKMKQEDFKGTYNQLYANMQAVENPTMKKAIEIIGVNETQKQNAEAEDKVEYQKQLLAYFKLTGTDYLGEPTLKSISAEIVAYNKRKEAVEDFNKKFADADIAKLKASCTRRGIPEEKYIGVEDTELLKKVIIEHIMSK